MNIQEPANPPIAKRKRLPSIAICSLNICKINVTFSHVKSDPFHHKYYKSLSHTSEIESCIIFGCLSTLHCCYIELSQKNLVT